MQTGRNGPRRRARQLGGENADPSENPDCEKVLDNGRVIVHGCNTGGGTVHVGGQSFKTSEENPCEETLDGGRVNVNRCNPDGTLKTSQSENQVETEDSSSGGNIGKYLGIVLLVLVLLCGYCVRARKEEKGTERSTVFSYLHAFDLEDIEVRHSATGGWHGTYVGSLAKGEGARRSPSSSVFFTPSHSSVVSDSLFVDSALVAARAPGRYRDHVDGDMISDADVRVGEDDDDFDTAARLDKDSWKAEII